MEKNENISELFWL
jgi:hypothetical protein